MTRRLVWGMVAGLALLVLVGLWFKANFEQAPVEVWTEPGKEARRNPHLALERFMAAMGRPLARVEDAAFLDKLRPGGVLILDRHRRAHLSPARTRALFAWVEAGGYLIAEPEDAGIDDPIQDFFDVGCSCREDKEEAGTAARNRRPAAPGEIPVVLPEAGRPLRIDYPRGQLVPGDEEPEWRAGAPGQPDQLLHFRLGAGHVTLFSGFSRLYDNRHIGHRDHAELLWTLVETYQPDRSKPVAFMTRLAMPSLWQWLAESAWTAVASAAVLLALWLWRVVPRFGPVVPEPPPGRRELGEHLAAVGRYVWRAGGLDAWLEAARESFRKRLALRHPAILALPPAEQAAALAAMTRRPVSLIAAALHGPAGSPQSFTLALRTLYTLERVL